MKNTKSAAVRFSASGYGTQMRAYRNHELAEISVEREAAEMALDRGLPMNSVIRCEDEWTLQSATGEEIARWEIV